MAFDHALNTFRCLLSPKHLISAIRHDLFYAGLNRNVDGLEDLGDRSQGCNWTTRTKFLTPSSVIYSAGVGKDISFEHALVDTYGVNIELLDPSPTALETMALAANQRKELRFHKLALAGHTGTLEMAPPADPVEGSWISQTDSDHLAPPTPGGVTVPCTTVGDLMRKLGHTSIDLLKIDIEGAEYQMLEAILQDHTPIRQIAVEFHSGILPGIPRGLTIKTLLKLYRHGYRIIHKTGSNHTLYLASEL